MPTFWRGVSPLLTARERAGGSLHGNTRGTYARHARQAMPTCSVRALPSVPVVSGHAFLVCCCPLAAPAASSPNPKRLRVLRADPDWPGLAVSWAFGESFRPSAKEARP